MAVLMLFAFSGRAQIKYFPDRAFSSNSRNDQFASVWYSRDLRTLEEPSLLEMAKSQTKESYRFLWLRTFHHPVSVRLEVNADGAATVTTKIASGEAGFNPGVLTVNISRTITSEQTKKFLNQIKGAGFWALPSHVNDQAGTDGSEWVIEGASNGRYHVVTRWSPQAGAVHSIGLILAFDLAQIDVPKEEVY
jgi:hypothetical protein